MTLLELLVKASHSVEFATRDLPAALAIADPVEAITVLKLCEQANILKQDLNILINAIETKENQ